MVSDSSVTISSSSASEGERAAEAAVERLAGAHVPLGLEHLDGQVAVVRLRGLDGAVGGPVVGEDHVAAVAPQVRTALQVGEQARDVGLLVVGRDDEDGHQ